MESVKGIRILKIIFAIFVLYIIWVVISSISIVSKTGILSVSTVSGARVVVAQTNHLPQILGEGSLKTRLLPGVYSVFASNGSNVANGEVTIVKGKTSSVNLNGLINVSVPSLSGVTFVGITDLLSYGMPSSQATNLQLLLFKSNPHAKSIDIDQNSISYAPHNPSSASTLSSVNFSVYVGTTEYSAVYSYDNLGSSNDLKLYSINNNALVFESSIN